MMTHNGKHVVTEAGNYIGFLKKTTNSCNSLQHSKISFSKFIYEYNERNKIV